MKYTIILSRAGTLKLINGSPLGDVCCTLKFSVDQLATAPLKSLPLHSLSTPSFLDVRMSPPGRSYGHCCEALALGLCNCIAYMQCAVPLSLLFSFLAPPAMLRTDCSLLCTQRGAGAQPRQQDVRASSNCSLESKSSAFSSSDPMLPPALRYLTQHGRYEHAVSFAAGVRAGGWRGAGERAFFAAGISRATNTLLNPLKCRLYFLKRAHHTHKRAYESQKRAFLTQKRALISRC